ncbi:preprotein translocase subunit SecY [Candidatus Methanosphaera massiliense]|jgi:preprotein translocase subunit SecY|uniref:preprotein translocase subunit SecY n=1 Tax=Methanosphaera TaxID=2316 RepID=UPI002380283C|nr:preprotein translocase subunit SecY [Candidatus Methanosphaera massiliense]MDD6285211.1 preprotein translocase subunit SecY [Methanobacteriaceae archaeon]MDE4078484.1 preprotein translocase subunit SecY [Candidatus Methanosphaera massiliense]MDY2744909.1 preprotein translocase subunit SecY [Methanosphaera sp.]
MSSLDSIKPFYSLLPQVVNPDKQLGFREKIKWTGIILILYFILTEVSLYGLSPTAIDQFAQLRSVMAGSFGSILTLGIGPIVTASIVMQLLVGGKLIDLDLSKPEDKSAFQGTQKLLAIIFTLFEGAVLVITGSLPPISGDYTLVLILQMVLGGILIIYMDEVVSKWGFGSGIGLFIAAGVAQQILVGAFNFLPSAGSSEPAGKIPAFIYSLTSGQPNFGLLLPVIATIIVFLVVVYAECMRVEIPLSYGGVKGARSKYPLKFVYASNMPVILVSALFLNVQLFAGIFQSAGFPILGEVSQGQAISGIAYYLTTPTSISVLFTDPLKVIIYAIVFIGLAVVFALLWVEISGIGSKQVSKQLSNMGVQVPGFRSSKVQFKRIMDKYIPTITVLGGAFVGLLAFAADLTGALGGGTGVLLTVGVVYRLYEEMAKEQLMDMHPMMRRFLGEE